MLGDDLKYLLHTYMYSLGLLSYKTKSLDIGFHRDYGITQICFGIKSSMLLLKTNFQINIVWKLQRIVHISATRC